MTKHTPIPLSKIREAHGIIRNPRREQRLSFTPLEQFALSITRMVGTIGFFMVLTVWTIGWLLWNLLAPAEVRFDPAPAFVVWLFTSNVLQLILLPLVMVGQNLEGKAADLRAEADFEINQKAEQEIEAILEHLENQEEVFKRIEEKLK